MVEWFFDREFVEVQIFLGLFKIKIFSTKFYYLIKISSSCYSVI